LPPRETDQQRWRKSVLFSEQKEKGFTFKIDARKKTGTITEDGEEKKERDCD